MFRVITCFFPILSENFAPVLFEILTIPVLVFHLEAPSLEIKLNISSISSFTTQKAVFSSSFACMDQFFQFLSRKVNMMVHRLLR